MTSILETERLILREWKDEDIPVFVAMNQDPRVMEFFPALRTEQESRDGVEWHRRHFKEHGFCCYAVEIKETGEFIGFVGLAIPPYETHFSPCVEIGWRLAHQFWGKGYATEAAKAVLESGFEKHGLKEIVSFTTTLNKPSMRVMEKIGLKRELNGDFDHPISHVRHVLYHLSMKDYKTLKIAATPNPAKIMTDK
ncbi:MAG: GNAT family N-acetyltransferase [Gammaproteobacteria bacterium]|nr:GNAT family N-acetyltransferase [Gammaproteobacteria bacterium]